ncbi:MAG: radical SAM family heme chaperone HemW [Chloroflexi bacterium]|nr:radical SAM family heme chaperone HemW [Chloroflexota bacterium]
MTLGLYVHIPFCETKCPYCDFNTYAAIESLMPGYVDALEHEIEQWGAWLERPMLTSLFFGGGTPSYLPTGDIRRLVRTIQTAFVLPDEAEATLEANPGDCSRQRLQAIRRSGINRISIGVQSFDDNELRLLGRRHTVDQAKQAVEAARVAGFDNLSIDLMFGLPYQYVSSWEHSLDEAIALAPEHISAYSLTLEGGTPMEADVKSGRLPEGDSDLGAEMYRMLGEKLAAAGYEQYEISNWAKPCLASTHNLSYWHNEPFLAVGPGAHGYLMPTEGPLSDLPHHGVRFAVIKPPRTYIERAGAWQAQGSIDERTLASAGAVDYADALDERLARGETMMMGLRLNEGVEDAAFRARFGVGIKEAFPKAVSDCLEDGLLEWADGRLRLTDEGRPLGNEAFGRFVAG